MSHYTRSSWQRHSKPALLSHSSVKWVHAAFRSGPLAGARWVCTEARQLLYFPQFRFP